MYSIGFKPVEQPPSWLNWDLWLDNFIDAVRTRNRDALRAEIRETHLSTALCHLGNIAYRMGRELRFDPGAGKFVNDPEADKLLTREYRKPYVVPEQV